MKKFLAVLSSFMFLVALSSCKSPNSSDVFGKFNGDVIPIPVCLQPSSTTGEYTMVYEPANNSKVNELKIDTYKGCITSETSCTTKENLRSNSAYSKYFFTFEPSSNPSLDIITFTAVDGVSSLTNFTLLGIASKDKKDPIKAYKSVEFKRIPACLGVYAQAKKVIK